MKEFIFRAYDIRGRYPAELDVPTAFAISLASASMFAGGVMVVGRDARLSSPALARAVIRGLRSAKRPFRVLDAGILTTPFFYFLVNRLKAAGGIMVTASHNPKEYNGLKVVGRGAVPIEGVRLLRLVRQRYHLS